MTDDELTALALAADPDTPVAADAVPFVSDRGGGDLLPEWYMPAPGADHLVGGWRRVLIVVLIAAFVLINIAGLCVTYGRIEIA